MPDQTLTFTAASFAVDKETRTLTGVLLPFNEVSRPARDAVTGKVARFSFAEGTITLPADPNDVVLNYGHDGKSLYTQVGVATELTPQPAGVLAKFKVARTPEGDRVLALAEDRVLKAFSAEVEGEFSAGRDGVQHAKATTLTGAAVVPIPAFTGAQITSVAASAASNKEEDMPEGEKETGAVATFSKEDGTALMAQVQSLTEKIAELENVKIPVGPGTAQFQVVEEPIYRFEGTEGAPSGFDFATDLLAAGKDGDMAALARLQKFTAERLSPEFVTTAGTTAVNQPTYRPDMFLGQAPVPASPLYDYFHKGSLNSVQPFFWSKLDRAATNAMVRDHAEGVEPTPDDVTTATGTTVTPTPVSGKVHITREVADQGGNPVVSGLVWSEFERSFKIALETRTADLINAAVVTELGAAIAVGATGLAAGAAVEAGLLGLQFLADGFRFSRAFGHVDLYTKLGLATNAAGDEKIYPIINPQNRDGQTASKFAFIDIAGYNMYPAASLGATGVNDKSYVADPNAVHVWNSGLQRLDKLLEDVEGWDMGVFAYFAGVVYDVTGLRKITYNAAA